MHRYNPWTDTREKRQAAESARSLAYYYANRDEVLRKKRKNYIRKGRKQTCFTKQLPRTREERREMVRAIVREMAVAD